MYSHIQRIYRTLLRCAFISIRYTSTVYTVLYILYTIDSVRVEYIYCTGRMQYGTVHKASLLKLYLHVLYAVRVELIAGTRA